MTERPEPHQMESTYVHLEDGGKAHLLEVTESFWPDLITGKLAASSSGRLISAYSFGSDWDTWEVHPNGDELVYLISGVVDFVLEQTDGEQTGGEQVVRLDEPGSFVLVPQGTWHTARIIEPARALFVTAGVGTQNRPV